MTTGYFRQSLYMYKIYRGGWVRFIGGKGGKIYIYIYICRWFWWMQVYRLKLQDIYIYEVLCV